MLDEKGYPKPEEVREELQKHLEEEKKKNPDLFKKQDERYEKERPKGDEAEK